MYSNWFTSFSKDTGNKVNYQAVGSGAGVRQFKAKTVDFGASDGAVSDKKQPAEGMVHVPMTGGAIVPAYNNPGCDKMTQTELADVFLGKIDQWSHFGCEGGQIKLSSIVLMDLALPKVSPTLCLLSLLSGRRL